MVQRSARAALAATVAGVLVSGLTACSAAEDIAVDARDAAAARASQEVSKAVVSAVRDQVCAVVGDGRISAQELDRLRTALDQAGALGLPEDLLGPARQAVEQGRASTEDVNAMRAGCAAPS